MENLGTREGVRRTRSQTRWWTWLCSHMNVALHPVGPVQWEVMEKTEGGKKKVEELRWQGRRGGKIPKFILTYYVCVVGGKQTKKRR